MLVQIGRRAFVMPKNIVKIISISEIHDRAELDDAQKNGNLIPLRVSLLRTAVFLTNGKIILAGLSAKTLQKRLLAAQHCSDAFAANERESKEKRLYVGAKNIFINPELVAYIIELSDIADSSALRHSKAFVPFSRSPRTAIFCRIDRVIFSPISAKTLHKNILKASYKKRL